MILAFILPFLYIVGLTTLLLYISHKKYSFATELPFALILATLSVFLFTYIFHNISVGFWITVAISASSIVFFMRDKDRLNFIKNNLITPSFIVFCLVYIFIFLLNWNKVVAISSDTTMHWAPHVLAMWLNNDFYTSPVLNIVIHGDYPPGLQLFELIWSKTAGLYREGLLYTAIQILSFSMILPMLDKLTWHRKNVGKDILMAFLLCAIFISIPLVFFVSDFYSSLEVDTAISFIFAYCVHLAITESNYFSEKSTLKLSIALTFLCLTKQIAPLLSIIVIFIYISNLLINYQNKLPLRNRLRQFFIDIKSYFKDRKVHKKTISTILICIILPFICMKIWSAQTANYQSPDASVAIFHFSISDIAKIPSILTSHSGTVVQQNFSRSFITHILYDPSGLILDNISSISYAQCAFICLGFIFIIGLLRKNSLERHRYYNLVFFLSIGWFLYCLAIFCVFLFGGMKTCEMVNMDTSNRYIRTYLFAMFLIAVWILLKKIIINYSNNKSGNIPVVFIVFLIIFFGILFNPHTLRNLGVGQNKQNQTELASYNMPNTTNLLTQINDASNTTIKTPAKILITANTDHIRHYVQYKALPNQAALLINTNITSKKTCSTIKKYDYLLVNYYYSDSDWTTINSCLTRKVEFSKNSIYKITTDSNNTKLIKIN